MGVRIGLLCGLIITDSRSFAGSVECFGGALQGEGSGLRAILEPCSRAISER